MQILGIETSCDDTSAAIVDESRVIHAHVTYSQLDEHRAHGGVVPEIGAREHLAKIEQVITACMDQSGISYADLDGVAATSGPGLIGGVMVGMMSGKAIAAMHNIPFLAVNHLEGHALTPRLSDDVAFPYLLLLISGGHTQLIRVEGVGQYHTLGTTLDDAAGECFDKCAKLLGLGWPGGPVLESCAQNYQGSFDHFPLPTPMKGRAEPDFSFSGLKTALRTHVMRLTNDGKEPLSLEDQGALAAALQHTITETLADRVKHAMALAPDMPLVVAGGVASNQMIRNRLKALCASESRDFIAPPPNLCTDNGAMIAWAGIERLSSGEKSTFDHAARPRWPLDEMAPPS